MKEIYLFSGLGADERVFKALDLSGFNPVFIQWIAPIYNESMHDYARRLLPQIPTTNPTLIGLSFGGLIAIEVSKLLGAEKTILIGSVKSHKEIPVYYRIVGKTRLHKILPASILKRTGFFSHWLFGVQTKDDKKLLSQILTDTDPVFLKWAIHQVVNWKNTTVPKNLVHIHGTADRILPIRFVAPHIRIIGGGHFMTVNKARELTQIINNVLKRQGHA